MPISAVRNGFCWSQGYEVGLGSRVVRSHPGDAAAPSGVGRNQSHPDCITHETWNVVNVERGHQLCAMQLDRLDAEIQRRGDLLVQLALGDELQDFYDPGLSDYIGTEGWLARFSMTVAGVSLNPDERIAMRKALRRIIQVNLPVFADAGMALVEFQQTDSEQFSENNAPLYFTNGAFSCVAPAFVRNTGGALVDVNVTEVSLNPTTGQPYP